MSPIFLTEEKRQIFDRVQELCHKNTPLKVAVAYWGDQALKKTGLQSRINTDPKTVQVLCDLESGSCNPDEIQKLINADVQVKSLKGLHAKVWISENMVVIGSANASSNGLGFYHDGHREAAVCMTNESFAKTVTNWFDRLWDDEHAICASQKMDLAEKRWNNRKQARKNGRPKPDQVTEYGDGDERYLKFFELLIEDLKILKDKSQFPLSLKQNKFHPVNRLTFGANSRTHIQYYVLLPRQGNPASIKLVVRTDNIDVNNDTLSTIRNEKMQDIEELAKEFEANIEFEEETNRKQRCISLNRIKIDDDDRKLDELREAIVKILPRFVKSCGEHLPRPRKNRKSAKTHGSTQN